MARDDYRKYGTGNADPAFEAEEVTPHATNELTAVTRGLYIGVSGDVVVYMKDAAASVTFTAVPVGILPIRCNRVIAIGTTATDIVALW